MSSAAVLVSACDFKQLTNAMGSVETRHKNLELYQKREKNQCEITAACSGRLLIFRNVNKCVVTSELERDSFFPSYFSFSSSCFPNSMFIALSRNPKGDKFKFLFHFSLSSRARALLFRAVAEFRRIISSTTLFFTSQIGFFLALETWMNRPNIAHTSRAERREAKRGENKMLYNDPLMCLNKWCCTIREIFERMINKNFIQNDFFSALLICLQSLFAPRASEENIESECVWTAEQRAQFQDSMVNTRGISQQTWNHQPFFFLLDGEERW